MRTKTVYVRDKARLRLSSFPNREHSGDEGSVLWEGCPSRPLRQLDLQRHQ